MMSSISKANMVYTCITNARPEEFTFAEAHTRLWRADLAYLVRIGWYRYRLNQLHREFFLADERVGQNREKICSSDLELLFALHSRHHEPVYRNDLYDPDRRTGPVSKESFLKRRSRLGMLFHGGVDPIRSLRTLDPQGRPCLAYTFERRLMKFMIIGTHRGDGQGDWSEFLQPPADHDFRRAS